MLLYKNRNNHIIYHLNIIAVKESRIKHTAHIVNLTGDDDTGNNKNIKEEGDPHKGWRQETNDKKSKEVIERVKLITSGYNGGLDIYKTLTITQGILYYRHSITLSFTS